MSLKVRNQHWLTPTSFLKRFGDAMQLLCNGKRPKDADLTDWLNPYHGGEALQDFAAFHGPTWAQGIVVIDAALLLARTPTEGVNHETEQDFVRALGGKP